MISAGEGKGAAIRVEELKKMKMKRNKLQVAGPFMG